VKAPSPPVALRPATPADEPFLRAVYASTREEELAPLGWPPATREAFLAMQYEAQRRHYRAAYPAARYDVIQADGVDAGRFCVARLDGEIRVVDLALLPAHRGRGIGTRLLAELLAEADARGLPVRIHVESLNPARRLYERLGFRLLETRGPYLFLERPPRADRTG
jgi:ribosomal protein S18 acetylase RimI-like enzyme